MQHEQVLRRPLVTEKATKTIEAETYAFEVDPKPTSLPSRRLSKPLTTCGSFA